LEPIICNERCDGWSYKFPLANCPNHRLMIGGKLAVTRLVDACKGKLHTEKAQYVQCNVLQQELKNDAMMVNLRG
jgi:hypothetical protein